MSEADDIKPEAPKPGRLSGLVAPKGAAARPAEQPQRTPETPPEAAPAPASGMGSKSLTLRLPEAQYERLRAYAYKSRRKHQDILSEALAVYLDGKNA